MVLAGLELDGFTVVPRYDTAESLFPLDLTFVGRLEIRTKNLISDIYSLMRALL
jgi:hypothetical protein